MSEHCRLADTCPYQISSPFTDILSKFTAMHQAFKVFLSFFLRLIITVSLSYFSKWLFSMIHPRTGYIMMSDISPVLHDPSSQSPDNFYQDLGVSGRHLTPSPNQYPSEPYQKYMPPVKTEQHSRFKQKEMPQRHCLLLQTRTSTWRMEIRSG